MPAVILSAIGGTGSQFFDNNGDVLSGGKLYTYEAGTTTPLATYTDSSGGTAQANPVVLDAAGRVPDNGIWLVYGTQYKFVLKDSAGTTIATWDNFPGSAEYDAIVANTTSIAAVNTALSDIAGCFVRAEHGGAGQAITAGSTVILQYNSEVTDLGNDYDPTTYTFTVPATGNYILSVTAAFDPSTASVSGDVLSVRVYKNGSLFSILDFTELDSASTSLVDLNGTIPLYLTSGDLITIYAYMGTTNDWNFDSSGGSFLSITRIS